jgi:K+-transporting ATPase KdpF subunit
MSTLELFYVLGGVISVALLVYLVYALICAEEF